MKLTQLRRSYADAVMPDAEMVRNIRGGFEERGGVDLWSIPHTPCSAASGPPSVLKYGLALILRHTTHSQRSYLAASPEPLQADRDLPSLFFLKHEDVSLAFRISDAGAEHMESFELASLR